MNVDPRSNGEHWLLDELARGWSGGASRHSIVVVDVGANDGDYAAAVLARIPRASLICFEPGIEAAERLTERFCQTPQVRIVRAAVGDSAGNATLYDYVGGHGSEHASILPETFEQIYPGTVSSATVEMVTLDSALGCDGGSPRVNLLKIDVEGSEHAVLVGAKQLFETGCVDVIQMECNVHSLITGLTIARIHELLPDFDIFRLLPRSLVPIATDAVPYQSASEIFRYSNLVAVNRNTGLTPGLLRRVSE